MPEAPLCVSFDSAADIAGVCLSRGEAIVAEATWLSHRNQTRELLPTLEWLLARAGCAKHDLGAVCVDLGPGSYAGLRVGLSTAKALAYGLELPLAGIDRLAADALPFAEAVDRPVVAVHAAGRAELAWGVYRHDASGLRTLVPPTLGHLQGENGAGPLVPAGSLVVGELDKLDEATTRLLRLGLGCTLVEALPNRVVAIARLGARRLAAGAVDNVASLVPLYLRPPAIGPQP